MNQKDYLAKILSGPATEGVEVCVSIPGGFMSSEKKLPMNDTVNSIGQQIATLKEIITMGSQTNSAMMSAEMDMYARVKVVEDGGRPITLPLSMAVGAYDGKTSINHPQAIMDAHKIQNIAYAKDFYSLQWPSLYAEFGSVGVDRLLKDKGLNSELAEFLSIPQNSVRVSPGDRSLLIETGQSKTIMFSAHNDQGVRADSLNGSFANVNLAYLVNKGLSKYPSLQAMIASDIGVEAAIKKEHIKEGASVLATLKKASVLTTKELAGITNAMPWVNKSSIKKFSEFEKIIYDNSYPAEDRIGWVLDRQEELGRMKAKDDLNIKDSGPQYSVSA